MDTDYLLTVDEVCGVLRVHKQTLYHWIRDGKIPSVSFCGLIRIEASALKAFLAEETANRKKKQSNKKTVSDVVDFVVAKSKKTRSLKKP